MAAIGHYDNFDLLISAGAGDAYQVRVLAAPGGGATAAPVAAPHKSCASLDVGNRRLARVWRSTAAGCAGWARL